MSAANPRNGGKRRILPEQFYDPFGRASALRGAAQRSADARTRRSDRLRRGLRCESRRVLAAPAARRVVLGIGRLESDIVAGPKTGRGYQSCAEFGRICNHLPAEI